ncbi:flagellar filament capping protein FliD [Psychromonas sp. 14N.309.X.WAT.B.A12]|uniref:flagellar filament capping protein FliD n=1 Tax=unclassified Psychromonas TaxID=2614957 RepID=UPI0025B0DBF7|nr:flagellar filament capping protein FliD [Psychromonas sp. 14N.309.X.WAT.B.A12]MDN2662881.1 flagellar filament capping protein FliD [Psychromonas sp. 14N.309.X.WAT.B.A12]
MTSITSTGLGSGLDINNIVTAIVAAEKDPAAASILADTTEATEKISAFGTINSALSDFQDSFADLSRASTFSATSATSSDESILTTTLGLGAETGSWSFEVKQQAKAQTIASSPDKSYSEATSQVGTGIISLSYGTYNDDGSFSINPNKPVETLTIDAENNSLDKMRDTINEGDYSVSASLINDGNNYRLVLINKETGEENAMQLTVEDDDGINNDGTGLSAFTFTSDTKNMQQTSVAQNAIMVMDGIEISRPSNNITNVIEGVTLNIAGETEPNSKVSLTIVPDMSTVEEQIYAFVENYNGTIKQMNALSNYGADVRSNGILSGDSTVRNIKGQMRDILNTNISHLDGSVRSFADLGMLTNRDGTLALDAEKLNKIMNTDMQSVADFFTASGGATDSYIDYESKGRSTVPGSYDIAVTKLASRGELTASSAISVPFSIDQDNDSFKMRLDGYLSGDIELASKTYDTIEEFTTELQSKINSDPNFVENNLNVSILENAGMISIVSNAYGSMSTVAITEIEDPSFFSSQLGLTVAGGVAGENVEGLIDGKAASGRGQFLESTEGKSKGLKAEVTGGELGDRGKISYSQGISSMLNSMLDGIIDSNVSSSDGDIDVSGSTIDTKFDSLYKQIGSLQEEKESLTFRMENLEERLYSQFNAMDTAVSNLNSMKDYLKSALDALPGYTKEK